MSPLTLAPKPVIQAKAPISSSGTVTGVITAMPAAADEVRLVVLNSLGELASEERKPVKEIGLVALDFGDALIKNAGKEIYFLMVQGYVKGAQVWEQHLGRYRFHQ